MSSQLRRDISTHSVVDKCIRRRLFGQASRFGWSFVVHLIPLSPKVGANGYSVESFAWQPAGVGFSMSVLIGWGRAQDLSFRTASQGYLI